MRGCIRLMVPSKARASPDASKKRASLGDGSWRGLLNETESGSSNAIWRKFMRTAFLIGLICFSSLLQGVTHGTGADHGLTMTYFWYRLKDQVLHLKEKHGLTKVQFTECDQNILDHYKMRDFFRKSRKTKRLQKRSLIEWKLNSFLRPYRLPGTH